MEDVEKISRDFTASFEGKDAKMLLRMASEVSLNLPKPLSITMMYGLTFGVPEYVLALTHLESMGWRGGRIEMIYREFCNSDIFQFRALLTKQFETWPTMEKILRSFEAESRGL